MIKKAIIVLIGMLFWAEFTSAQMQHYYKGRLEFELNDVSLSTGVTVLKDSTYIIYGSMESFGSDIRQAAFLRFSKEMIPADTMYYGKDSNDIEIKNLFELPNGYLAIGHIWKWNEINRFNPYLIRLNKNLDTLWTKKIVFGQDTLPFVSQVIMCHDSTLVIGGSVTKDSVFDDPDIMFLRIDTLGNVLNYKKLGFLNIPDDCWSITQTLDKGFALGGYTKLGHPLDYRYHIVFKLDSMGNQQWYRKWGRNDASNGACGVLNLMDSTILISTARATQAGLDPTLNRISNLQKITYDNSLIWNYDYGSVNNYYSQNIYVGVQQSDSTILCIRHSYDMGYPIFQLLNNEGITIWERQYKFINGQHIYYHVGVSNVKADEGFVLSGFLQPCFGCGDTGTQDIFVIKTNCLGFADPPFADAVTGSLDNFEVVLENNSMYFGNVYINWGDGNTYTLYESSDTLIYHTYATDGNFNATVIAEACGDADTLSLNVVSSLVGVSEYEKPKFRVYPNPANETLYIQMDNLVPDYEVILMDISGKTILRKENAKQVDVSDFSGGIYFIRIPELNHIEKLQIIK
jgi:hypothetical protein